MLGSPNGMNDHNSLDDLFNTRKFMKPKMRKFNVLPAKKISPAIKFKMKVKNNISLINNNFA